MAAVVLVHGLYHRPEHFAGPYQLITARPLPQPRAAHGFRNPANQRLRTRCVTTRRARGHLRTAQL